MDDSRIKAEISRINDKRKAGYNRDAFDEYFWLSAALYRRSQRARFKTAKQVRNDRKVDAEYRIVNLVMQGGGVLGLAHAGFIMGLEAAGIRFAGIAGTSAGSIAAMGIVATRENDPLDATGEKLVKIIDDMPMIKFIDGNRPTRILIKQFVRGRKLFSMAGLNGVLSAIGSIIRRRGLNSGKTFESEFTAVLRKNGLSSMRDLDERLEKAQKFFENANKDLSQLLKPARKSGSRQFENEQIFKFAEQKSTPDDKPYLKLLNIIGTAMPIGLAIRFPQELKYFDIEYERLSPALMVRASMSIPLFFEPVWFSVRHSSWASARAGRNTEGKDKKSYFIEDRLDKLVHPQKLNEFAWLDQVYFLDGGLFSNLPSDSFDELAPDVPTISVPLLSAPKKRKKAGFRSLKGVADDVMEVADAVRLSRDRAAIIQRQQRKDDFKTNQKLLGSEFGRAHVKRSFPFQLAEINTKDANWLDFEMTREAKVALILMGLKRANKFVFEDDKDGKDDANG